MPDTTPRDPDEPLTPVTPPLAGGELAGFPLVFARSRFERIMVGKARNTQLAYTRDLDAITAELAAFRDLPIDALSTLDLTRDNLEVCFARYSAGRSQATYKRCWSTWTSFCTHLVDRDMLATSPMAKIPARSAGPGTPAHRPLNLDEQHRLITTLRTTEALRWPERDLAVVFLGLATGARATEMAGTTLRDLTRGPAGTPRSLSVLGKGGTHRTIPIEAPLVEVLETYLASRLERFQGADDHTRRVTGPIWDRYQPTAPLLVNDHGRTITRQLLRHITDRAFRTAGIDHSPGAATHRLRHTFATTLADTGVPVHHLRELLGHASLDTTQRYLTPTSHTLRNAAATNPLYGEIPYPRLLRDHRP